MWHESVPTLRQWEKVEVMTTKKEKLRTKMRRGRGLHLQERARNKLEKTVQLLRQNYSVVNNSTSHHGTGVTSKCQVGGHTSCNKIMFSPHQDGQVNHGGVHVTPFPKQCFPFFMSHPFRNNVYLFVISLLSLFFFLFLKSPRSGSHQKFQNNVISE